MNSQPNDENSAPENNSVKDYAIAMKHKKVKAKEIIIKGERTWLFSAEDCRLENMVSNFGHP